MLYAGVDYHKRYSQVHVIDEHGRTRARARLATEFPTLCGFFASLGEPARALVEAAWVAVWLDPYFRAHFAKRRAHKPPQSVIIATARRLLEVVWHVLKENRPYQTRPTASSHWGIRTSSAALATS